MIELLKTNYKNDVLHPSMNGERHYQIVDPDDRTVIYPDVLVQDITTYDVQGDKFGKDDINKMNEMTNKNAQDNETILTSISDYNQKYTEVVNNATEVRRLLSEGRELNEDTKILKEKCEKAYNNTVNAFSVVKSGSPNLINIESFTLKMGESKTITISTNDVGVFENYYFGFDSYLSNASGFKVKGTIMLDPSTSITSPYTTGGRKKWSVSNSTESSGTIQFIFSYETNQTDTDGYVYIKDISLYATDIDDYFPYASGLVGEDAILEEIEDLKKSVADGKQLVANAISEKGVDTATDATFATMASNISSISSGGKLELLWENPNKTASFEPQSVIVDEELEYNGYVVAFIDKTRGSYSYKGSLFICNYAVSEIASMDLANRYQTDNKLDFMVRRVFFSGGGITFTACFSDYYDSSTESRTMANDRMIPILIYGVVFDNINEMKDKIRNI